MDRGRVVHRITIVSHAIQITVVISHHITVVLTIAARAATSVIVHTIRHTRGRGRAHYRRVSGSWSVIR